VEELTELRRLLYRAAERSFHRPATRVEDSINSALDKIAQGAQPQRPN